MLLLLLVLVSVLLMFILRKPLKSDIKFQFEICTDKPNNIHFSHVPSNMI